MDSVSSLTCQKLYLDLAKHKLRIGHLGSRLDLTDLHAVVCTPWRSMDQLLSWLHLQPTLMLIHLYAGCHSYAGLLRTMSLHHMDLASSPCTRSIGLFRFWFVETTTSHTWCFGESTTSSINCLFEVGAGNRCWSLTFADLSSVEARHRSNGAQDDI